MGEQPANIDRFLSVSEVAEILGLSATLIYREVRSGHLASHCFGGKTIRISQEDLGNYISSRRCEAKRGVSSVKHEPQRNGQTVFKHLNVSKVLGEQSSPRV